MKTLIIISFLSLAMNFNDLFLQKSENQSALNEDKFFEINYENLLKQKKSLELSQLATKVEYIQLETNSNCLVTELAKYFVTDSLIFISNRDHILKFSYNGKFLKKIGKPGRGPGEINRIQIMSIIPQKRLLVVQNSGDRKLLYFSFDGELIKTIATPGIYNVKVMNDGRYIAYDRGSSISENYTFSLTNEFKDTISVVKNYTNWTNPDSAAIVFYNPLFEPFYISKSRYYFKSMYNDTIWVVNGDRIESSYFINMGKFKLPDEKRTERLTPEQSQSFSENSKSYYFANDIEAADRIFLTAYSFGDGPTFNFVINNRLNKNLHINYDYGNNGNYRK